MEYKQMSQFEGVRRVNLLKSLLSRIVGLYTFRLNTERSINNY